MAKMKVTSAEVGGMALCTESRDRLPLLANQEVMNHQAYAARSVKLIMFAHTNPRSPSPMGPTRTEAVKKNKKENAKRNLEASLRSWADMTE